MTDAELLEKFRQHESADAFSVLVNRHSGWVYSVARRRVGDEHLAYDVAQAVFLLLAERAKHIREPSALTAWLLRTTIFASNHAIRSERRLRRREQIVASGRPEIDHTADPMAEFGKISDIKTVEETVNQLNEADRSLIVLRFYEGYSLSQVGTELSISEDAARKRLDRAWQRLRPRLEARGVSADAWGGILGGLLAMNRLPPITNQAVAIPTRVNATLRTISIVRGVTHMRIMNRIRAVSATVAIMVVLGMGIVLACGNPHASTATASASTQAAPLSAGRTLETSDLIVVISSDRTKVTGYSKRSGVWSQIDGKNFAMDGFIVSDDAAVYHDNSHVYGFSAVTSNWSNIDLPDAVDPADFVGPIVALQVGTVAVPGFVYAYSAITGTWDTLKVAGGKPLTPAVSSSVVTVDAGDKFYIFGAKTGKWSSGF